MPIISIKEAADRCSIPPKNIHTYIARGKIIKRNDNLIDDSHPVNKDFFAKYYKEITKTIEEKLVKNSEIQAKATKTEEIKSNNRRKKPSSDSENDYSKFELRTNLDDLRAEKLAEEIIALKLKNQRLEGEVIETELIKQATFEVVNAFRLNLLIAAKSNLRNALGDISATNDQITQYISNLEVLFNSHTSEALENVKTTIERIL